MAKPIINWVFTMRNYMEEAHYSWTSHKEFRVRMVHRNTLPAAVMINSSPSRCT
jgi:hypothetical protein